MVSPPEGILDTSVVIHALGNDANSPSAQAFIARIESGETRVVVDPLVIHELTYAFSRFPREFTRERVAEIVLSLLDVSGSSTMDETLRRGIEVWRESPGLSFVDAYLGARALAEGLPVYTVNRKDFLRQGVEAPDLRELMGTG